MTAAVPWTRRARGFEPWMISNVAVGMAVGSFLTLLVPPFITDVTGSAARVGIVFALVSLAATVGPWFGGRADRSGRHRRYYLIAMIAVSGSFALLALASAASRWSPLFGVVLGASYAVQGTIGPAFIVGSGLSHADIARQLTAFALTFPAGQLLGAVLVAIAEASGMSTTAVFLAATVVLLALTVASWPFLRVPADRLAAAVRAAPPAQAGSTDSADPKTGVGRLLRSLFGLFLLAVMLSSIGNNGLTSQLANVMPHVYGFTDTATSLLLGAAGLINIPVILVTGKWLTHTRTINVYAAGTALRAVGALAMALIGLMTTPVLVLAAIAMLITYQGVPVPRVAAADLAVQLSPTGPVQADGYYFAASAVGSVVGCLLAGLLAQSESFNAVNWLAAIASIAATASLWPLLRSRPTAAQQPTS